MATIDSRPDSQGEITQLIIRQTDTKLTMSISLLKPDQPPLHIIDADLSNLFSIRFNKYNLRNNQMTGGYVEYKAEGVKPEITRVTGGFKLSYKELKPNAVD